MTSRANCKAPEPEIISLKVCPFCGTPPIMTKYHKYGVVIKCGAYNGDRHRVMVIASTTEKAINEWNGRAVW